MSKTTFQPRSVSLHDIGSKLLRRKGEGWWAGPLLCSRQRGRPQEEAGRLELPLAPSTFLNLSSLHLNFKWNEKPFPAIKVFTAEVRGSPHLCPRSAVASQVLFRVTPGVGTVVSSSALSA